jgi:hypothetical protein
MKWRLSFFSLEGSGSGLPGALPLTEREREREREIMDRNPILLFNKCGLY